MSHPSKTDAYVLEQNKSFDDLKLKKDLDIPQLGDYDCLVKIEAVSLNYRDLVIAKGMYPFPLQLPRIPASDASATVIATGSRVTEFQKGDHVCTLFNQSHQDGLIRAKDFPTGLGGGLDGTLRQYATFPETGLVKAPDTATFEEASTLTCAPLTAWNALYGLSSRALKPGDIVLTQGTGGVSIAAVQFALAAGASVIATTSSDDKAQKLRSLGVPQDHIINYRTDTNWGETAKKLTDGRGVDHIIEVGGPNTVAQSLKAIKPEGVITIIGFLGGTPSGDQPSMLDALTHCCTIRGMMVGSRRQFEDMNRAIDARKIKMAVDEKIFGFEQTKEAYQYVWDQKHFGNVVIKVAQ